MDENSNIALLENKFGKDEIDSLFDEFNLNRESNIFISYGVQIVKDVDTFKSFDDVKDLLKLYVSEYGVDKVCNVGKFNSLCKSYRLHRQANQSKLETYDGEDAEREEEPKTETVEEEPINQANEEIINLLKEINENINVVINDRSDEQLMAEIIEVKNILNKQINTKTVKKATYEQVDKVAKEVAMIKEVLPKEVEQYYNPNDLVKFFARGVIFTFVVFLSIVLILLIFLK